MPELELLLEPKLFELELLLELGLLELELLERELGELELLELELLELPTLELELLGSILLELELLLGVKLLELELLLTLEPLELELELVWHGAGQATGSVGTSSILSRYTGPMCQSTQSFSRLVPSFRIVHFVPFASAQYEYIQFILFTATHWPFPGGLYMMYMRNGKSWRTKKPASGSSVNDGESFVA